MLIRNRFGCQQTRKLITRGKKSEMETDGKKVMRKNFVELTERRKRIHGRRSQAMPSIDVRSCMKLDYTCNKTARENPLKNNVAKLCTLARAHTHTQTHRCADGMKQTIVTASREEMKRTREKKCRRRYWKTWRCNKATLIYVQYNRLKKHHLAVELKWCVKVEGGKAS